MKYFIIFLFLASFAVLMPQSFAWCPENLDWKDTPCYASFQNFTKEKIQDDWAPYYDYKGKEWMEQKKIELITAIRDDNHHEWRGENDANSNVFHYYYAFYEMDKYAYSPLKQFKSGIVFHEIKCDDDLQLIQKYDGSPACVTESTKENLIERGWAVFSYAFSSFEIITPQSDLAIFYVQPQITTLILKQDTTIRDYLFSYIKEPDGWDHVFDRAFEEVPRNFKIGIIENTPNNIKEFVQFGKQNLPSGITIEILREEGYFVVYLTSDNQLELGEYDLSVISVSKTNAIIQMPLHVVAVDPNTISTQENIVKINSYKHSWGINLENISEQEYWIREDGRSPWSPSPILNVTDENIHPHVKELIDVMWSQDTRYTPSKYDSKILIAEHDVELDVEPKKIKDWLKTTHDKQFKQNLDDSFTSYIRYNDEIYSFGFIIAD